MDVRKRIKASITKLQTSGTELNISFASRLEKYVFKNSSLRLVSQKQYGQVARQTDDNTESSEENLKKSVHR